MGIKCIHRWCVMFATVPVSHMLVGRLIHNACLFAMLDAHSVSCFSSASPSTHMISTMGAPALASQSLPSLFVNLALRHVAACETRLLMPIRSDPDHAPFRHHHAQLRTLLSLIERNAFLPLTAPSTNLHIAHNLDPKVSAASRISPTANLPVGSPATRCAAPSSAPSTMGTTLP